MASAAAEILRRQLREKFPQAHGLRTGPELPDAGRKPFEMEAFPAGAISEVVPAGPVAGISLMIAGLMGAPEEFCPQPELVLVDGADGFDPDSHEDAACSKLLWVRCRSALEMVKAADLLVHDGNLPFILLDATGLDRRDLAGIPSSAWLRMKQAAGRNGSRVVIMAPYPLVPCARLRLTLSADLSLHHFDVPRSDLLDRLGMVSESLRRAT
ncbi:hypothetical protein JIN84_20540 [Luteolibacter yonseiensis]|uniref:Uncharacterized protein n=1 Tax=Luteolibacter yonseiensis TaxID=1144680 RepID=A0A934R8T7_9BACT|nr:hypothetical protein [Luteolibacter yonseiensis]MBK1818023.1 hypothetical protein [Luteolibacter yonseiensis]